MMSPAHHIPEAVATLAADGCLHIDAPYLPEFVADLKSSIHPRNRRWLAETKTWRIRPAGIKAALDVFLLHYPAGDVRYYKEAA